MSPTKKEHMYLLLQSLVFSTISKFKKDDVIQVGFWEDLMLFMIKRLMFMKIVESIWL
jgi:hypothetical protein